MPWKIHHLLFLGLCTVVLGCKPEKPARVTDTSYPDLAPNVASIDGSALAATQPTLTGLEAIPNNLWDEHAVKRVLHVFAFGGGHTNAAQITAWANMAPEAAIAEILYAGEHHPLLSPIENHLHIGPSGTLQGMSDYWGGNHPANPLRSSQTRYRLTGSDAWGSPTRLWIQATQARGLNPVRQKLGLYLTNYHMAVSHNANVSNWQMVQYYDDLMNAVAAGKTFDELITIAAGSAAVAVQYNHQWNSAWYNTWENQWEFWGNENFAREYFQLYFGILISGPNPQTPDTFSADYHETVSIKNMARLLTGMRTDGPWNELSSRTLSFNVEDHHTAQLEILGHIISGQTAGEKLNQLGPLAIEHPQSLRNLPIMIVQWLADDEILNKDDAQERIRAYWASLVHQQKHDLITFLRGYAISSDFHSPERIKYFNVFDRTLSMANSIVLTNNDIWEAPNGYRLYDLDWEFWNHGFQVFEPHHNVFGGQTGLDAYKNSDYFMRIFNFVLENSWRWARAGYELNNNRLWYKDWRPVLPQPASNAGYTTEQLGEWLWQRFIGDGLKHFGTLERAHVYALLASNDHRDLHWYLRQEYPSLPGKTQPGIDWDTVITDAHLAAGGYLRDAYLTLAQHTLPALPTSTTPNANEQDQLVDMAQRIGNAINFIVSTPYMFYQEGR